MAMDLLYLLVFMTAFMGPMLIIGSIIEYVIYDVKREDPDKPYDDN